MEELGLDPTTLSDQLVESDEEARAFGMHGSPTVIVDGIDVDERMRNQPASLHG